MEKAYEKLLTEHKLTITELPVDAQTGIKKIKAIEVALNMQDKKAAKVGKTYTPSAAILADIKTFDKWIVREILDYVEDKETNSAAPPVAAAVIIDEIKADEPTPAKVDEPAAVVSIDPKGLEIDKELAAMLKENKIECTLEELKTLTPTGYDVIFSTYKKGESNGIITGQFELLEKNDKFTLTKK